MALPKLMRKFSVGGCDGPTDHSSPNTPADVSVDQVLSHCSGARGVNSVSSDAFIASGRVQCH